LSAALEAAGGPERSIVEWVERELGDRVERLERQGRWRPAWHVDLNRQGRREQLYVRGERVENFLPYSLEREYRIHRLLEAGGVRVPHVHGFIETLPGVVMDRAPGRSNLATADSSGDFEAVRRELVEQMALMHSLPVEPFVAAGLRAPETPRATSLSFFDDVHANYLRGRRRPDPAMAFVAGWVLRNAPEAAEPPRYVACDAGQFLFEGPRLTVMMDYELSVLGDPMMDLAALRIRDQWEKLGDLPSLYQLYSERTGRVVDLQTVRFHTVSFALGGAMSSALCMEQFLASPQPDADYVEYLIWVVWELKQALAAVAEHAGLRLPQVDAPPSSPGLFSEPLFALRAAIDTEPAADVVEAYRKRVRRSIVTYLERVAEYGGRLQADYLDDAARVLGRRPANSEEADVLLEAYVQTADAKEDERLLRLFHAQVSRKAFLLAAPDSPYISGLVNPLIPI
jgi:aminoglycoside phosphotransferase (APT) family kinase protein